MGMGFKELQGEDVHASNFSAGVSCEVVLAWHCWHFACRYVSSEQSLFIWRGRRKKCKAGSHQESNPEPLAWASHTLTTKLRPLDNHRATTSPYNPLHLLQKRYWMLLSLRMYCQYSMGVDQKILSIREEQGLIRGRGGWVASHPPFSLW